mmetsp:Transcript_42516/g.85265  ORF Transcript_42516/g.85265 Transcript_42516/m.85265 type:complete len:94 (-) Transcript_42516:241-522(-)
MTAQVSIMEPLRRKRSPPNPVQSERVTKAPRYEKSEGWSEIDEAFYHGMEHGKWLVRAGLDDDGALRRDVEVEALRLSYITLSAKYNALQNAQ